jgi:hypothetical protein
MEYSLNNLKIDKNYLLKILQSRFLLYCAVCLLVLKIFAIVAYVNFPSNIFFADITKTALVELVNQTRQGEGLQTLTENQKLDQAAQLKAEDMVQKQYFSHTSPEGVTPWYWFSKIGYNYKYAGENLAIGFFDSKEVYNAWLDSSSHKANLLNSNYKEVGTAVLNGFGQNNAVVVVQFFGSQQPAKIESPASENNASAPINNTTEEKKTDAVVVPESEMPVNTTGEKVLAQTVESPAFTLYDYNSVLQDIIYGFLLLAIGALMFVIFLNIPVKRQLILRSALIIILLSFAALLNKEAIISIIPHQIII